MTSKPVSITQLSKNHLSDLRKLGQKKYRLAQRRTLVEGLNIIEQLLDNNLNPQELIVTENIIGNQILQQVKCPIYLAKEAELEKLADTESPQGVIAVYHLPEPEIGTFKLALYLDGIRDPGNMGTIFRLATAFDVDCVLLSKDCCEVFSPKVVRASLGGVFRMPSAVRDAEWMRSQNYQIAGLMTKGGKPLHSFKPQPDKPLILVVGSEAEGISTRVQAVLNYKLSIHLPGRMESLNAAVATGIALYELVN